MRAKSDDYSQVAEFGFKHTYSVPDISNLHLNIFMFRPADCLRNNVMHQIIALEITINNIEIGIEVMPPIMKCFELKSDDKNPKLNQTTARVLLWSPEIQLEANFSFCP